MPDTSGPGGTSGLGLWLSELKSVKALSPAKEAQIINYLKLSGLPVGYLLNFRNLRVEWKKFVNRRA